MNYLARLTATLILTVTSCVAVTLQPARLVAADPLIVVSIASVDRLLDDITFVARAANAPEVGGLITLMTSPYTESFDTSKPLGVLVTGTQPDPSVVVVLPVKDLDGLLQRMQGQIPPLEDAGGGIKVLRIQRPFYLKESQGWVFVSNSKAELGNLPEDPGDVLKGLNDKYEISLQVNVQNIPEELRQKAISELKEGFEQGLQRQLRDQPEPPAEIGQQGIDNFVAMIEETDRLTLGFGLDRNEGSLYLDMGVKALEGTSLGKQFSALGETRSNFAGVVVPDAAASLHFTNPLTESDIAQMTVVFKMMREQVMNDLEEAWSDESFAGVARDVMSSLLSVAEGTIKSGKLDGGGSLLLDETMVRGVAGGFVSDGKLIEESLKRLFKLAREAGEEPRFGSFEFNIDKHHDVDFHRLTVPLPVDEEKARKVLGDELTVVVGTGPKSAYVAFGRESADLLKTVIDRSTRNAGDRVKPLSLSVSLGQILTFASDLESDPGVKLLAETLADSAGEDHITVTATGKPNEVSYRLLIEEGVLQLIGRATNLTGGSRPSF